MRYEVTVEDTAVALGSGEVNVLATPRLIAWLEAATVAAAGEFLATGQTSVGTEVRVAHRRPSPVGTSVRVTVEAPAGVVDGKLTFAVRAVDGNGKLVGEGEIDRAVVDRDRFP